MTHWLGLPALASAHGGQIDGMIGWVHVFMLFLFVGFPGPHDPWDAPRAAAEETGLQLRELLATMLARNYP